jgi:hypothetical protein
MDIASGESCASRQDSGGFEPPNDTKSAKRKARSPFCRPSAFLFVPVIVTTFTAGHERTLPIWRLNQLGRPRDVPIANVVALGVMAITALPVLASFGLTRASDDIGGSGN